MSEPTPPLAAIGAAAPHYPVNLVVAGRRCLVVGGGRVAARKAAGLVACGADVTVVAPEVAPETAALAVRIERRCYRRGEVAGYRLVIAATGDPEVNQAVFDDGEAAGVWVNAADDPERCSVTLPAVVRRGPVTVTASTGGTSPALASWLRQRLAAELPAELAELAEVLARRRAALHAEGRSTEGIDWPSIIVDELERLRRSPAGGR